jgi:ribonuclease HII
MRTPTPDPAGGVRLKALTAGVDEAGRGPVLGPLVVACAITDDPEGLAALGVRDSKVLSPTARERLEGELKARLPAFALVVLEPEEIDRGRSRRSLNAIEGEAFAKAVAAAARPLRVSTLAALQADAADASETTFRGKGLAREAPSLAVHRFAVEHKADARYPAVSAASILAKVERDRRIRALAVSVGEPIGSGYPSDPATVAFLRGYIRANQDLPPFARRSWEPAKALLREAGLQDHSLDGF